MKYLIISAVILSVAFSASAQSKNSDGRFQLVQLGSMRRDQFLLDTHTGKIWRSVCYLPSDTSDDCSVDAWDPADIIGINTTLEKVIEKVNRVAEYRRTKKESAAK